VAVTVRGAVNRSTSVVVLVGCSVAAWGVTVWYAVDMPAAPGTMGLGVLGFVALWTVMMAAMMLPSLLPMLWRYRQAIVGVGGQHRGVLTALVAAGYFTVWTGFGLAAFPVGAALAALEMRQSWLARLVPIAGCIVVLIAGVLQLSTWKARHLACCRQAPGPGRTLSADAATAWRHGLRLGLHCAACCASLMAILLVGGVMDVRLMAAVTVAITVERLAPAGERVARALGVAVVAAGLFLVALATSRLVSLCAPEHVIGAVGHEGARPDVRAVPGGRLAAGGAHALDPGDAGHALTAGRPCLMADGAQAQPGDGARLDVRGIDRRTVGERPHGAAVLRVLPGGAGDGLLGVDAQEVGDHLTESVVEERRLRPGEHPLEAGARGARQADVVLGADGVQDEEDAVALRHADVVRHRRRAGVLAGTDRRCGGGRRERGEAGDGEETLGDHGSFPSGR